MPKVLTKLPTVQRFLANGGATNYKFTVTAANATVGATYTNNTQTFTVLATIAGSTTLLMSGTGTPLASGTLTKASGTGDATITFSVNVTIYIPPANCKYIEVEMVGAGTGGGGLVSGSNTTFGLMTANAASGATGGTFSLGLSGAIPIVTLNGGSGQSNSVAGGGSGFCGPSGGNTPFGGAGAANASGAPNTGSGGGGTDSGGGFNGPSGGGGGYIYARLVAPLAANYPYFVGIGGASSTQGASGQINVREYY